MLSIIASRVVAEQLVGEAHAAAANYLEEEDGVGRNSRGGPTAKGCCRGRLE